MTDKDVEHLLDRLTPRGVRPELRPEVLAAVESQLEEGTASAWPWRSALAVAALLLLGIAMNVGVNKVAERRMAQLFGPPPISKQAMELANAVEKITDPQTARWVYQQFAAPRPCEDESPNYAAYSDLLRRLINESLSFPKDTHDEAPKKDNHLDRDRSWADWRQSLWLPTRCSSGPPIHGLSGNWPKSVPQATR